MTPNLITEPFLSLGFDFALYFLAPLESPVIYVGDYRRERIYAFLTFPYRTGVKASHPF
jgi:hypothetical protein